MTPTKFLQDRNIVSEDKTDLIIGFDNGTKESLIDLLEKYHQVKLKLLGIADVSGSLVSPNAIQKEAEKYQKATANKMAIERTAFAQGALWVRSLFLPNDR